MAARLGLASDCLKHLVLCTVARPVLVDVLLESNDLEGLPALDNDLVLPQTGPGFGLDLVTADKPVVLIDR